MNKRRFSLDSKSKEIKFDLKKNSFGSSPSLSTNDQEKKAAFLKFQSVKNSTHNGVSNKMQNLE